MEAHRGDKDPAPLWVGNQCLPYMCSVFRASMDVFCAERAQRRTLFLSGEIFWQQESLPGREMA